MNTDEITENMRTMAANLVKREDVKFVIGYETAPLGGVRPIFVHTSEQAQRLVFTEDSHHNLVSYLPKEDKLPLPRGAKPDDRKVGVFLKPCEIRSLNQLLSERGTKRENVIVIGLECHGVYPGRLGRIVDRTGEGKENEPFMDQCYECESYDFEYDEFIGDQTNCGCPPESAAHGTDARSLDAETGVPESEQACSELPSADDFADRFEKWQDEFSKCIRCYACRNVCPLCYCEDCFVDRLKPQWVERGTNQTTNAEYLMMRAYHIAGRCVECGACEAACPVDIPHMEVNRFMAEAMRELYGEETGKKKDKKTALCNHCEDDRGDDIW